MDKPQPYPEDNGLLSFCLSSSLFFEVGYPAHVMSGSPQWSSEVGAAVPGGWGRPGQGRLLEGAGRFQEELVIHSTNIYIYILDIHDMP